MNTDGTATRTIRLFSSILSYAVDAGVIERSPALGIKVPPSGRRHRYLSPQEVRGLGEILNRPSASEIAATAAIILKFLILTGARRGEIEELKWSEVDFQFGMLRKEKSKTGTKIIPLARAALKILEAVDFRKSEVGFPGTQGRWPFRWTWNGMEWSGVEWSGVEWSGVEWSGVEWSGVE